MEFDLQKIVHQDRDTSSGYHLMVARGWRILGENQLHAPLAYSAFEFRCSIERALIELFVLIRDKNPSKADIRAMNSIRGIRKAIYFTYGSKERFQRTMTFNRLYVRSSGAPRIFVFCEVDIDIMERYWSKLSEYCHRQLKPATTWQSMGNEWLLEGYKLLSEVEEYLWGILETSKIGWVQTRTMQPEVLDALTQFVGGVIDQATLDIRLNLMSPIIAQRALSQILTFAG